MRAASGLGKLGIEAAKAAGKAAAKGAKNGIQSAVKEVAHAEALRFMRGRVGGPTAVRGLRANHSVSFAGSSAGALAPMVPPQLYPTFCECEENPRAEDSPEGHKILRCHGCASKGMAAREYHTTLEAFSFMSRGGPRRTRSRTPGGTRRSGSRTPGGTRRSKSGRSRSRTPGGTRRSGSR